MNIISHQQNVYEIVRRKGTIAVIFFHLTVTTCEKYTIFRSDAGKLRHSVADFTVSRGQR